MIRALNKLVRLAELRRDLAQAELLGCKTALEQANLRVREAQEGAVRLAEDQEQARRALRASLVGSPELRGALESVLTTFTADRQREAAAEERIQAALNTSRKARTALQEAQAGLVRAERQLEKRRLLRQPILDRRARAAERRDELEAEELSQNRRVAT